MVGRIGGGERGWAKGEIKGKEEGKEGRGGGERKRSGAGR